MPKLRLCIPDDENAFQKAWAAFIESRCTPCARVFENPQRYIDSNLALHGRLLVSTLEQAYLAADKEEYERGNYFCIEPGEELIRELRESVPHLGGGPFLLNLPCRVKGRLNRVQEQLTITVTTCVVKVDYPPYLPM